jgi:hypothetical protein
MKAIEYLTLSPKDMLAMFVKETQTLLQKRPPDSAIREQIQKAKAICDRSTQITLESFEDILQYTFPDAFLAYNHAIGLRCIKRERKLAHAEYKKQLQEIEQYQDPQIRLTLLIAAITEKMDRVNEANQLYSPPTKK